MPVWISDHQLAELKNFSDGDEFFIDGTFRTAPKGWAQFYTFRGRRREYSNYIYLFHMICFDCPNLKMAKIIFHLDFEEAVIQAIREYFPNAIIICCFFHLMQLLEESSRFEPKLWARCCFDKIIKPEVNQIF